MYDSPENQPENDEEIETIDSLKQRIKLLEESIEHYKKSKTETTEDGYFKRTIKRYGKKKKTRTEIIKQNPEKVAYLKFKDIELYKYPYDYPDKLFLGNGKGSTIIDPKLDKGYFWAIANIIQWEANGGIKRALKGKSKSMNAKKIENAYNKGVENTMKKLREEKK